MPKIKTTGYLSIAFLLLPLIAFAGNQQEVKEHKVVRGDTLWGISKAELNDPFLWPRVWKDNPGIKNPNRIYPDQIIRIPPDLVPGDRSPEDVSIKSVAAPRESVISVRQQDQTTEKELTPKPGSSSSPQESVVDTPKRYQGIKGIILYSGKIIEGQIISMNAEILKIRTQDGKVRTCSFEREVKNFIKE